MPRLTTIAAACCAAAALAVAGCGGEDASSDEDQITEIIVAVGDDPVVLCDHLAAAVSEQIGGKDGCVEAAKATSDAEKDPDVAVESIEIDGDKATAQIIGKDGEETINFVREDGDWKYSS